MSKVKSASEIGKSRGDKQKKNSLREKICMLFVDKCIVRADNEITDNSINGGTLMKKILA